MKKLYLILTIILLPQISVATELMSLRNLSFGTVSKTTGNSSVSIGLSNNISAVSGLEIIGISSIPVSSGMVEYAGTKLKAKSESVKFTSEKASLELENGVGGKITIRDFVLTDGLYVSTANTNAIATIGATAILTAASTPGTYTGTVKIKSDSKEGGKADNYLQITMIIKEKLEADEKVPLSFGEIATGTTAGVIKINPATGARTIVSGTNIQLTPTVPGAAARIEIKGEKNTAVSVVLPSAATITGPGAAMTLNTFTQSPASGSIILDVNGKRDLYIGANLNINAGQAGGTYNGTYQITINY